MTAALMTPTIHHSARRGPVILAWTDATTRASMPLASSVAASPMSRIVNTDAPTPRSMPSTIRPRAPNRAGSM